MRIKKYKNIYQITFLPNIFPINCYIYEEISSLTLIDIGTPLFCKAILKLSKTLNKSIDKIILTHPHQDHVSGLDSIKKYFPEASVYISERDNYLLKGDFTIKSIEEKSEIKGGFCKVNTISDELVKENDYIGSLKVLMTPGHTPGSISLYEEKYGILVVGDALQVKGGISIAGDKRFLFPFPALATWSFNEAIKSVRKLYELDIAVLATGHGDMVEYPKEKILEAINRAEKRSRK